MKRWAIMRCLARIRCRRESFVATSLDTDTNVLFLIIDVANILSFDLEKRAWLKSTELKDSSFMGVSAAFIARVDGDSFHYLV